MSLGFRLFLGVLLTVAVVGAGWASRPAHAAFPGTNGKIAFVRDVNSDVFDPNYEIFTMNPDGSAQTRLTFTSAQEFYPAWSPDGSKIAFATDRDGDPEIYVMNADGSAQTNLTNYSGIDGNPAWSPDGTKIAFFTRRSGFDNDIATMNADGTGAMELTTNPDNDIDAAWAPDGTTIAFVSRRPPYSGRHQLFLNAGGAETQLVVTDSNVTSPDWSPDASRIAFTHLEVTLYECHNDILVVNRDGTGLTTLLGGSDCYADPAWSPDGSKIAFARGSGTAFAVSGIYSMNVDGSGLTLLADQGFSPDWQPVAPYPTTATPTMTGTATPTATPRPVGGLSVNAAGGASAGQFAWPLFAVLLIAGGSACGFALAARAQRVRSRTPS